MSAARRLLAALAITLTGSASADSGSAADRCLARATEIASAMLPAASQIAGVTITPRVEVFGGQTYAWSERARNAIVIGAACRDRDEVLISTVAHELGHHVLWGQGKNYQIPTDGDLNSWLMSEGEVAASVIAVAIMAQAMPHTQFTLPMPAFAEHLAAVAEVIK